MGLELTFWTGNDEKIVEGVINEDYDVLRENEAIEKKADLSLHIVPDDLNTLSKAAAKFNHLQKIQLRDFVAIIVDEPDHGLMKVHPYWVQYFSKVKEEDLGKLAEEWYKEMKRKYPNDEFDLTIDMVNAVRDLHDICTYAVKAKKTLFHFWG